MLKGGHRETGKLQFKRIIGSQTIKQFGAFLSSSNNKLELIRFLASKWQAEHTVIKEIEVNVAYDDVCIQLGSSGSIEELACNHEEADTRMLFHAKNISESYRSIVIHTPNTDVLLIALGVSHQIRGNIFIKTGTQKIKPDSFLYSKSRKTWKSNMTSST